MSLRVKLAFVSVALVWMTLGTSPVAASSGLSCPGEPFSLPCSALWEWSWEQWSAALCCEGELGELHIEGICVQWDEDTSYWSGPFSWTCVPINT